MKSILVATLAIALINPAFADDKIERMSSKTMDSIITKNLKWADEPTLPKGAKSALVVGDPTKAGVFILRLKFPANYQIPAHTHPYTEVITVLKGKLGNGMGKKFDASKGEIMNTTDSFVLPADHSHYVWTMDEETELELVATGPWDITYINPADDPRKRK